MITNKLNCYIGYLAFIIFWILVILHHFLNLNGLIIIPSLIVCMLIQTTALWIPDSIYIPIKFLGMTSETLFLENIKEGDEFLTDFGTRFEVILKKDDVIVLNSMTSSLSIPIERFANFLRTNAVSQYNGKPLKFDPLW